MFYELRMESFKSFGTLQYAPLAPITLIFGPNSGGKSSLIQSLLLIKQSLVSSRSSLNVLDFNGHLVDLGDFQNTVFKHETKPLRLGFSYGTEFFRGNSVYALPPQEANRSVDFGFIPIQEPTRGQRGSRSYTRRYIGLQDCAYTLGAQGGEVPAIFRITLENADDYAKRYGLRYKRDREHHYFRTAKDSELTAVIEYLVGYFGTELMSLEAGIPMRSSGRANSSRARRSALRRILTDSLFSTADFLPSAIYGFRQTKDSLSKQLNNEEILQRYLTERYGLRVDFLLRFADEVRYLMDRVSYIGPFRRPQDRIEILRNRNTDTVGRSGEYCHYMLSGRDPDAEKLNEWLKKLNVPYSIKFIQASIKENSSTLGNVAVARYRDERFGTDVSASDIGYGIGQIIPIIIEGILSENKTILVEQPELHLHPKLQADIADLFIDTCYSENRRAGNQWIVETHSELILLRILRRIREGKLDAAQVKVIYVDPPRSADFHDLGSQICDLELNASGHFMVPWPDGFFDEQAAEAFAGIAL